jgi:hypothetical protein
MANFALNYSYSRNLNIPLDEDAVKSTLSEVLQYVHTKSKCYAGQLFSVTGDTTTNNGLYITLSVGPEGGVLKLATQNALDAVAASAGKIDKIQLNGTELTINDKVVNIDLTNYATTNYVDVQLEAIENQLYWLPVGDGVEKHKVRKWRGTREKYEFLLKNNALDSWTKYVVIDTINDEEVITEYYGTNQVSNNTGQLLPVISIIGDISEINPSPYDRYLVGSDGIGYHVYEYVIDSEGSHRWIVKTFDYRYGVRVIEEGLKNYVYINGNLISYDDVDCGTF